MTRLSGWSAAFRGQRRASSARPTRPCPTPSNIASAGEIKTKPTQHSVKELREIGIQPDSLLCRTLQPLPEDERRKIALFCNVQKEAVISAWDVDSIYKIPMMLHEQMLDEIVCHKLKILARAADLSAWRNLVHAQENPKHEVDIAFVGKYVDLQDSYKSLNEALTHAGIHTGARVNIHYLDSEEIEKTGIAVLEKMDAILVPGGFGQRGTEGKMRAIRHARENGVPYLGICLGMQLATIEFARNVVGLAGANSTEFFACHEGIEQQRGAIFEKPFAHERHVVGAKLDCAKCHRTHEEKPEGEIVRFEASGCVTCHHQEPVKNCLACHGDVRRHTVASFRGDFDHAMHLDDAEKTCADCHDLKTPPPGIRKAVCAECHEDE